MSDYRLYEPTECGRDGYPLVWHQRIKHEVKQEAGHRCIRCHHPYRGGEHGNGEWSMCDKQCEHGGPFEVRPYSQGWIREAQWRILTVHHLDGNKRNLRWWNLVALCQRCHLEVQGRVRMQQVYPWEHADWFKPYAAGYYAWCYQGEDLSREEVLDRLDELLGLECAL